MWRLTQISSKVLIINTWTEIGAMDKSHLTIWTEPSPINFLGVERRNDDELAMLAWFSHCRGNYNSSSRGKVTRSDQMSPVFFFFYMNSNQKKKEERGRVTGAVSFIQWTNGNLKLWRESLWPFVFEHDVVGWQSVFLHTHNKNTVHAMTRWCTSMLKSPEIKM